MSKCEKIKRFIAAYHGLESLNGLEIDDYHFWVLSMYAERLNSFEVDFLMVYSEDNFILQRALSEVLKGK